jgi:iron(III) transport system substrate-binding protein
MTINIIASATGALIRKGEGLALIRRLALISVLASLATLVAACGGSGGSESGSGGGSGSGGETTTSGGGTAGTLTVYSGREEELLGPAIEMFEEESDVDVEVRYGDTAELASTILEEGENSPADVFFAQDAGALGAVSDEGLFTQLPDSILQPVEDRFKSQEGQWVGISGRARVVAYSTERVDEAALPASILEFTDPAWEGRIGWPPTNGSFQAFVTALRETEGEDGARQWLEGMQANDPSAYEDNTTTIEAIDAGEVDVGFVNHYYLFRFLEEQRQDFPVRNYYPEGNDPGALVNVAGAGIMQTSDNEAAAQEFIEYMLSEEAQQYFADETYEYPMIDGIETNEELTPLDQIQTPNIDLSDLDDLEGTLELLRETGVL